MSSTSEQPVTESCQLSEYGCCPDGVSPAVGNNFEGCLGVDFDNCTSNGNDTGRANILHSLKLPSCIKLCFIFLITCYVNWLVTIIICQ